MTHTNIKDTAEQFAKRVQKHRINTGEKDQGAAMASVMRDQWPSTAPQIVNATLVLNSVEAKWRDTERKVGIQLVPTGQIDMFGFPGFMVPKKINDKPWQQSSLAESDRILSDMQKTAKDNAEEHRRLWESYDDKATFLGEQRNALRELMKIVREQGHDPETMTYEQAQAQNI